MKKQKHYNKFPKIRDFFNIFCVFAPKIQENDRNNLKS